jgi:uncharacterized membrane-anchored protein
MTGKSVPKIAVRLMAIALIQTLVLGWMVWDRVTLLREGREVTLAVVPVDPRDLLRGDYVILSFSISRIDIANVTGDRDVDTGNLIYVGLKKFDGGLWKAVSVNKKRPQDQSDVVFIKGKIYQKTDRINGSKTLRIDYGMEKYFIPEGDGPGLEKLRGEKVLSIVAAVSDSGEAGIKALLVRGQPVYQETIF